MPITKYQLLADEITRAIASGGLTPGMRLPSVRDLMKQHALSLATVMSALRILEEQGLIEPRHKAGFFVRSHTLERQSEASSAPIIPIDPGVSHRGLAEDLFHEKRWQRLMLSVIRRQPHLLSHYPQGKGSLRLRAELSAYCAANGLFLKEEELVITQGATEGLLLALRAVCSPGDSVMVQAPIGELFRRLLEILHLKPVLLNKPVDSDAFIREIESHASRASAPKVLLLIANFHYPTGSLMPLSNKRELLRLAENVDLQIIEDDVYGDLQHDGPRPLTIKSYDLSGRVIYVNSCSKSMAPGLRIGWLAAGRWMDRICYLKNATSSSVGELPQIVLSEYLAQGSHLPNLRKLRQKLKARKDEYLSALRPALSPCIQVEEMAGGFCYWLPLPSKSSMQELRSELCRRWPNLVEGATPCLDVVEQGLCINTSVQLDPRARQSLLELCKHLRTLYK